ncbi:MAG: response regulator [Gemmatimonadaceae bacterium]|nr:response regulator [Chitinophagaceae bacterium]
MLWIRKFVSVFVLTVLSLSGFCQKSIPLAVDGILDLRSTNLDSTVIPLKGEWGFYWNKLIKPSAVPAPDDYVPMPVLWKNQRLNGNKLTNFGYASYALTIYLPKKHKPYSLYIPDACTNYELFLNGKSISKNGRPDSIKATATPFWATQTATISQGKDTLNFVLHISNYWHTKGGPHKDILLGSRKAILLQYRRESAVDLTLAGCLFMGGLFFLGLFIFSRKNTPILYFSLFCMIYSYRMVGTKLHILNTILPDISWFLTLRLEYLSLTLAVACFAKYSGSLYPKEAGRYGVNFMIGFCFVFSTIIILAPTSVFTCLLNYFLALMFLFIVFAFFIYGKAVRNKRSGALFALLSSGVLLMIFLIINLEYFGLFIPMKTVIFSGYIVFFFLQSLVLSRRFSESFRQANIEAQQGFVAKSEFLSTMSHEIRTPLNSVIGMAHLLQRSEPRPDQKENLDVLLFSANNLISIVNNILDYNKIEAGKISIEKISMDLPAIARNITAGLKTLSQEKRILLELDIDPLINQKVIGDPTRTTQVITNLLHNAIKFTKAGKVTLKLKVEFSDENEMRIKVSVTDTGIGIAEDKQQLIFERFTQADSSTSRSFGGTGLGLSISKKILELQGSALELTSVPGEGSTFFFTQTFPLTTESIEAVDLSVKLKSEKNLLLDINILLVEDNPINVLVAKTFLERCGAIIDVAGNGQEALDRFEGERHDIVLMDLDMPVLDGYDATRRMRQRGITLPVIALTASLPKEVESEVFAAGLSDIIVKPFNPEDLFRVILQHLKAKAA